MKHRQNPLKIPQILATFCLISLTTPSMALPPDDFQLFAAIFFVLLAVGLVISVAFAAALYFFLWYGRRKAEDEKLAGNGQNRGEFVANEEIRPIQWVTTTYRQPASVWSTNKAEPSYSGNLRNWKEEEFLGHPRRPSLGERLINSLANLTESARNGCRKFVDAIQRRRTSSPPSTIFPTSPPPSYMSAQSPEFWTGSAAAQPTKRPQLPPATSMAQQQPKSILKKPTIRWPIGGNGRQQQQWPFGQRPMPTPTAVPIPVLRGEPGPRRMPPPIPKWQWNPRLAEGPAERVVEDRLEREESCRQGRLVAVERLTRTTTTTKQLDGTSFI